MAEPDISFDPSDNMQVAVYLARMGERMAGMQIAQHQTNQHLRTAIEGLQVEVHAAVGKLGELTELSSAQKSDNDSLKRVWQRIELHTKAHADTNRRFNILTGLALGISFSASIVSGTIAYVGNKYIESVGNTIRQNRERDDERYEATDRRLDGIELHMAGDPARPYKRQ